MANDSISEDDSPAYIPTSKGEIIRIILTGIAVGVIIVILSELIAKFFITPVFCRSADSFSVCSNGGNVAFYSATIITNMAAVALLVRFGVFRPLLVAIGAAAMLWGIRSYISGLGLIEFSLWLGLLYGLSYLLLFWVLRVRNFIIALIIMLILIVFARLVLML